MGKMKQLSMIQGFEQTGFIHHISKLDLLRITRIYGYPKWVSILVKNSPYVKGSYVKGLKKSTH